MHNDLVIQTPLHQYVYVQCISLQNLMRLSFSSWTFFSSIQRRIQRWRTRCPPSLFEIFLGCVFVHFYAITRINFIVINMQCLQYVFYSLLSLQKHRICVKGQKDRWKLTLCQCSALKILFHNTWGTRIFLKDYSKG